MHHFCIKRHLSNFLSVLQSVVVFRSRHNPSEQISKIIRLLILTELTLSKMAVLFCTVVFSVSFPQRISHLPSSSCSMHLTHLLRRIWLWTESRHVFQKNNLKSPIFWVSKEGLKWKPLWTVLLSLSLLSAYKDCLVLFSNFESWSLH